MAVVVVGNCSHCLSNEDLYLISDDLEVEVVVAEDSVVEGVVRKERQPLLHSIATHHINQVLIREDVNEDLLEFKQFLTDQFQKHPTLRNLFTLA